MFEKAMIAGGLVVATVLTAVSTATLIKANKIGKKFDKGVTELESITIKDIQEKMVEDAVKNAAEDKVGQYVYRAHKEVMDIARDEIKKEREKMSEDERKRWMKKVEIKDKVSAEIIDQASKIDIEDMRKSVREKAENQVLSKFKGDLNDLLEKYSGNLQQINQIYSSVANALGKGVNGSDNSQKLTFSLS